MGLKSTSPASSRLSPKLRCDGVFDVECADWDRFNVAATRTCGGTQLWRSPDELVEFLLLRGGTWWAHAGGIYDFLLVAEQFRARGIRCQISLSQSRISSIRAGSLFLRDSFCLLPLPLAEAAAMVGMQTHTWPWSCACGRECGGYCRIPQWPDPDVDEHVTQDVLVLERVLRQLAEHAEAAGIELRGTVGACAWATARAELDLPAADLPAVLWRRMARAVKGGRTLCGRMRARGPGAHWDLASAHAASLARVPLPCGYVNELGVRDALGALEREMPGVYQCQVTVPEMAFPPLPWRLGGRIVYPTGTFTGLWCLPELAAAIDRGVQLDKVHTAITWTDERVVFDGLMKRWFALRTAVGKEAPLGQWFSELMRTLTGKFAESPEREIVLMHPKEWIVCLGRGPCREGCTGRCGAYRMIDKWGEIVARPIWRPSASGHLAWNVYLTAGTRIAQLEGFERVGHQNVVYGATDSVWCTGERAPGRQGKELGAWAFKHPWIDWECAAPGHYAFTRDGIPQVKVAGASKLTRAEWERGHAERARGVATFAEAAREGRGLFRRRQEVWTMPRKEAGEVWLGDRILDSRDGLTYPADAEVHRGRLEAIRQRRQGQSHEGDGAP